MLPIVMADLSTVNTTAPMGRLLVVGLGLIGGSLALAARQRHLFSEVIGTSRSPATLQKAMELGVVDRVESNLSTALAAMEAGDIVVVGVPTLTVPNIIAQLKEHLAPEVSFTDVASVKGSIVASVRDIYGAVPTQFVPGHPIAGSEKSGVAECLETV